MTLTVGSLSFSDFSGFLSQKFAKGRRRVEPKVFERVFTLTEGITGDVQQLCEALWTVTDEGEVIVETTLPKALRLILAREQKIYEIILSRLTAGYVRTPKALARLGGDQPTASAFVREAAASNPSAIVQGLRRMAEQKIVFHDGARWRFTNPFFGAWLLAGDSL